MQGFSRRSTCFELCYPPFYPPGGLYKRRHRSRQNMEAETCSMRYTRACQLRKACLDNLTNPDGLFSLALSSFFLFLIALQRRVTVARRGIGVREFLSLSSYNVSSR